MLDPDTKEQLDFVKASLLFINKFCRENCLSIENYLNHKTNNVFSFLLHLKNREINIYSVFGFNNFDKQIKASDLEVLKFMFGDMFLNNLSLHRIKFFNSEKCKILVTTGLQKLLNFNKKNVD